MDYFEWFGVDRKFNVDQPALRKTFLAKSMELHPDRSTFDDDKQIELAEYNNLAYTTLKDDNKRFEYVLTIENIIVPNEKPELPQSFLMEMLEMNMEIDDAKSSNDKIALDSLKSQLDQKKEAASESIQNVMDQYDTGDLNDESKDLLKNYYFIRKYLLRIEESIYTFASH